MMFCTDNTDLSHKVSSFFNRSLIILSAGSIGTEVNNAETSYEQRHSPGKEGYPFDLVYKVPSTLYVMGICPQVV